MRRYNPRQPYCYVSGSAPLGDLAHGRGSRDCTLYLFANRRTLWRPMALAKEQTLNLAWPWQDRNRGFSWLKVSTFALMFLPAIWLIYQVETEQFGPVPVGGMTY